MAHAGPTRNAYRQADAISGAWSVAMGDFEQSNRSRRRRTPGALAAAGLMVSVVFLGAFGASPVSGGAPAVEDADLEVTSYGFESGISPTVWTVSDDDTSFGTDHWFGSARRAAQGNGSAWSAGVGVRDNVPVTLVDTSWENGWGDWQVRTDVTTTATWDISDNRANTGSYSMYSAGSAGGSSYYDRMSAWLYYDLPSGFSNGWMNFSYWMAMEYNYDYWYLAWYDGSWRTTGRWDGFYDWRTYTFQIPSGASKVGFHFETDTSVTYEGLYIDDVTIEGLGPLPNAQSGLYDDGMDARMHAAVDVSAFAGARIDYSYWIDAQSGDYLEFMYYTDTWYFVDRHEGSSTTWQTSTLTVPTDTTRFGFRFVSDGSGRAEGAYIDDIHIIGTVLSPTCSAQLSATSGIEQDTIFYYDGFGSGGYRNYTWSWDFGDGGTSTFRSPSHVYQDPGTYSPSMTLTDELGQVCAFDAPTITVEYDLSEIIVAPVSSELTEGTSREFNAETRYGHQLNFDWRVDPANCGEFSVNPAPRSVFTASHEQGGYTCTVVASYAGATGGVSLSVLHDLTQVVVTPPSATVFASQRVILTATDPYGHPYSVQWWATCGRVLPDQGDSTTFSAVATPGSTCVVTAESGTARTTIPILVQQDPTNMTISPTEIHVIEGAGASFEAKDSFGKPLKVDWTVSPASCGELTITNGATTSLQTSLDAGGTSCRVTGSISGYSRNATVIVEHDLSGGSVELGSETVEGGGSVTASAYDKNGHALTVDWSVSPGNCGELDPQSGPSATLTASDEIGEVVCTLTARRGTLTLLALVSIELGPPASIEVTFLGAAPEGGQTEARAQVRDAGGHALDSSGVSWTTTCAGLSRATGATTLVRAPETGAGTTCTVTASFGGVTGTGDLEITRGPAARIEIQPSNIQVANGQRVELTLKAWDQYDHEVVPTTVIWAASCGSFEGEGVTVTYIAPASGGPCQISATVPGGTVGVSASSSVGVSGGLLVPVVLVAVVAAAAVAGILLWRRSKGGKGTP